MTEDEPTASEDARIGRNVQDLRKARGMSQDDLARALSARGHPFHQPTIAKVESGTRPLRFTEANALANALDCDLGKLLREEAAASTAFKAQLTAMQVQKDRAALRDAVRTLVHDSHKLELVLERGRIEGKLTAPELEKAAVDLQPDLLEEVQAARKAALAELETEVRDA